ncbi:MAG: nickel pincer cofactor biosynthesis protein LarB [Zavarzinella sp.]
MNQELIELLQQVKSGQVPVDLAATRLMGGMVSDLGFAQVDLDRQRRCGFPEVIYCEGKDPTWIVQVVERLHAAQQSCLGTRLSSEQATHVLDRFPTANYDSLGRTFWLPVGPEADPVGRVLVLTAGTVDLPVAHETIQTIKAMGVGVELIADVGVAGLHRLLRHLDHLRTADVVIVVAGMDGALPSVVGGLVDVPVIAVPTSVGYGTAFHGVAALLTMLNACSAGVVTVNIDAGFKAGYTAALIAKRIYIGKEG